VHALGLGQLLGGILAQPQRVELVRAGLVEVGAERLDLPSRMA